MYVPRDLFRRWSRAEVTFVQGGRFVLSIGDREESILETQVSIVGKKEKLEANEEKIIKRIIISKNNYFRPLEIEICDSSAILFR